MPPSSKPASPAAPTVSQPVHQLKLTRECGGASLSCVLVHGTAARDAKWVQPDSFIAEALASLEPSGVRLYKFLWSGANTHDGRVNAAQALSEQLAVLGAENSGTRFLLVGHSHGGNVAMAAIGGVPASQREGVVCLATPFFHVRPRNLLALRWVRAGLLLLAIGLWTGFALWLSTLVLGVAPWIAMYKNWAAHLVLPEWLLVGMRTVEGIVMQLVWFAGPVAYYLFADEPEPPAAQRRSIERWQLLSPKPARSLCIWFGPDEAYAGLRALRRIGESGHAFVTIATRYLLPAITLLAATAATWLAWSNPPKNYAYEDYGQFWRGAVVVFIAAATMVFVPVALWLATAFTATLTRFLTGKVTVADHLWLDIFVQRTPQVDCSIEARPLVLSDEGFWKSLKAALPVAMGSLIHSRPYTDERTPAIIRQWYRRNRPR